MSGRYRMIRFVLVTMAMVVPMAISTVDIITSTRVKPRWRRKVWKEILERALRLHLIISIILDCCSLILRTVFIIGVKSLLLRPDLCRLPMIFDRLSGARQGLRGCI